MEIAIYSTIECSDLAIIEKVFKKIMRDGFFKRIEQGTVLLYEDSGIELAIEPTTTSFYLSGRIKDSLCNGQLFIYEIAKTLKDAEIQFSLDYQEENGDGQATSSEFNLSNKSNLTRPPR